MSYVCIDNYKKDCEGCGECQKPPKALYDDFYDEDYWAEDNDMVGCDRCIVKKQFN